MIEMFIVAQQACQGGSCRSTIREFRTVEAIVVEPPKTLVLTIPAEAKVIYQLEPENAKKPGLRRLLGRINRQCCP